MMTQGIWDHLNDRTGIYYIANGLGHLDTSLIEHKAVGEHALVGSRPCRCDASQQTALKPACSSAERTWCIVLWSPSRTLLICFIHPFIQSLIWSLVDSFIHSFFIHSFIHSFIHACIHSFIHPSIHPSTHSFLHASEAKAHRCSCSPTLGCVKLGLQSSTGAVRMHSVLCIVVTNLLLRSRVVREATSS